MGIDAREKSVVENTIWETSGVHGHRCPRDKCCKKYNLGNPPFRNSCKKYNLGIHPVWGYKVLKGGGEGGPSGAAPGPGGAPGALLSIVYTDPPQTVCGRLATRLLTMGVLQGAH